MHIFKIKFRKKYQNFSLLPETSLFVVPDLLNKLKPVYISHVILLLACKNVLSIKELQFGTKFLRKYKTHLPNHLNLNLKSIYFTYKFKSCSKLSKTSLKIYRLSKVLKCNDQQPSLVFVTTRVAADSKVRSIRCLPAVKTNYISYVCVCIFISVFFFPPINY